MSRTMNKVLFVLWIILELTLSKRVPRKIWKSSKSFINNAAKRKSPQIYRKTSITRTWKAFHKWNDHYLSNLIGTVDGVYTQQSDPVFGPYFDSARPLASHPTIKPMHTYIQKSMLMSQFLFNIQNNTAHTVHTVHNYSYLTREIERIHPLLEQDIQPIDELIRLDPSHSSINVWIGEKGVIAPCHYDGYHNVYVQIRGTKTFYLAPPTAHKFLRPFPFVHPSHAQCQERLIPNKDVDDVDVRIAKLQPGDVLYIPPLWFHEVIAEETSISVNGWTPSKESNVVNELFAVPLPSIFLNDKLGQDKVHKAKNEILQLTHLSYMFRGKYHVLFNLYQIRYEELINTNMLSASLLNEDTILNEWYCDDEHYKNIDSIDKKEIKKWIDTTQILLNKLNKVTHDIWYGNLIEGLLLTIVGRENADRVGGRLKDVCRCVQMISGAKKKMEL